MRGIFTAGVLDAMAEKGEPPFDLVIGVSAGAYCAAFYLAGKHGQIKRIITEQMTASNFVNPWRMLRGGSLVDQDFLIGPVTQELFPLDFTALRASPSRFEVVASHAATGEPRYLTCQGEDCLRALHATIAIPVFYRGGPVPFRGDWYFDGSVTDPIPAGRALELGATDVTVILTRREDQIPPPLSRAARVFLSLDLRDHPAVAEVISTRTRTYSEAFALLGSPPEGARIEVLAPPPDFPVTRFTRDREVVMRGYEIGKQAIEDR